MAQLQLTGVTGSLTVYGMISGSGTISGSNINAAGNITAATFTGGGSGLTGVVAASSAGALSAGTGLNFTAGGSYNGSAAKTINLTTPVAVTNGGTGLTEANLSSKSGQFVVVNTNEDGYVIADITSTTLTVNTTVNTDPAVMTIEMPQALSSISNPTFRSIVISYSGSVGGALDPVYRWKVYGDLGVTGTVYETSTIKIKENIESLTDEISKLIQVRPVEFDYIETGVHSYGFIAQELNEVYPDAVIKDENNEPIGVAYADLTSPIIRGMQQLYEKIEQLEERIKILELEKGA